MAYFPLNQHASACCKDMHDHYFARSFRQVCRRKTQVALFVVVDDFLTGPPLCNMFLAFNLLKLKREEITEEICEGFQKKKLSKCQTFGGWSLVSCSCFGCPRLNMFFQMPWACVYRVRMHRGCEFSESEIPPLIPYLSYEPFSLFSFLSMEYMFTVVFSLALV